MANGEGAKSSEIDKRDNVKMPVRFRFQQFLGSQFVVAQLRVTVVSTDPFSSITGLLSALDNAHRSHIHIAGRQNPVYRSNGVNKLYSYWVDLLL